MFLYNNISNNVEHLDIKYIFLEKTLLDNISSNDKKTYSLLFVIGHVIYFVLIKHLNNLLSNKITTKYFLYKQNQYKSKYSGVFESLDYSYSKNDIKAINSMKEYLHNEYLNLQIPLNIALISFFTEIIIYMLFFTILNLLFKYSYSNVSIIDIISVINFYFFIYVVLFVFPKNCMRSIYINLLNVNFKNRSSDFLNFNLYEDFKNFEIYFYESVAFKFIVFMVGITVLLNFIHLNSICCSYINIVLIFFSMLMIQHYYTCNSDFLKDLDPKLMEIIKEKQKIS